MTIKVVLIGDSSVGKTAIFQRLEGDIFVEDHVPTVGGGFTKYQIKPESDDSVKSGKIYELGIWDTAGQERFRNVIPMYFQRASFILIIYDVTSPDSFEHVTEWADMARDKAPSNAIIYLIGNKIDLTEKRVIGFEQAQELGERIGAAFVCETSAKSGFGIDVFINDIATKIADQNKIGTDDGDFIVVNQDAVEKIVEIDMTNNNQNYGNDISGTNRLSMCNC
ncbi:Ras-related protein RABH1c [Tritrichomonas foetus]|uniref:Ras-related protein RABH1c n=1 Tax=Tritrichomonas foetus TaxID=1144522 RepID=A0A1J4KUK7_9EUKA|nr:Ras-related protein RABH1c [Tritrichomonas foetus]|eukprot:OHT13181.1 Ras-related protein RABH1c [Tritrichomonas foetus]